MAANRPSGARPMEDVAEAQLVVPHETLTLVREREVFGLGTRTYPVWTRTMWEAIERYQREGFHRMGLVSLNQRHEQEAGASGLIAFPAKA